MGGREGLEVFGVRRWAPTCRAPNSATDAPFLPPLLAAAPVAAGWPAARAVRAASRAAGSMETTRLPGAGRGSSSVEEAASSCGTRGLGG